MKVSVVGAVRQTKYSRLDEAQRGRTADYDITQHRLMTFSNTHSNVTSKLSTN